MTPDRPFWRARLARAGAVILGVALLGACAQTPAPDAPPARAAFDSLPALPPMNVFATARAPAWQTRSNIDLAEDFLELSFMLESGRELPVFTRFETPQVSYELRGAVPAHLRRDLEALRGRLSREAGITLVPAGGGGTAQIVMELIPRARLQRNVPNAACFVVPNVAGWSDYLANRAARSLDWARLTTRTRATLILPADVSPQEMRDCLHEELAQALGPLNDLYRLHDSVFNDDNVQGVLTGFDMLMLRVTYDRALVSGMTRTQVAERLPGILARLNPAGEGIAPRRAGATPRPWISAIEAVIGPRLSRERRIAEAQRAVRLAERAGWRDNRLGFSLYVLGRLTLAQDRARARVALEAARDVYLQLPGATQHLAFVQVQLAALSLAEGAPVRSLALATEAIAALRDGQNAALLATALMLSAEAHAALGDTARADAALLDALGWARYGFGAPQAIAARLAEIRALAAIGRRLS